MPEPTSALAWRQVDIAARVLSEVEWESSIRNSRTATSFFHEVLRVQRFGKVLSTEPLGSFEGATLSPRKATVFRRARLFFDSAIISASEMLAVNATGLPFVSATHCMGAANRWLLPLTDIVYGMRFVASDR